ncbi:MAG: site-2 protease family protein [Pseudomonadota bacterium]|nr:site-2 protease family protein [Pseudomonadota bacterium]
MNDIQLGRLFGFPVTLQPSALAILAFFVLSGARNGAHSAYYSFMLTLVIFASIMVHELGHAFVARAYGLGPIAITLHGFGGLTRFTQAPQPKQGIFITLAGPIAGFLLGLLALVGTFFIQTPVVGSLLATATTFNLFWSAFNLLPMYPLDGGIVTYHGLSLWKRPEIALLWAARLGVLVAVGVGTAAAVRGEIFIGIIALMSLARSVPIVMATSKA